MSFEKLQAGSVTPAKRLDYLDHVFSMMKARGNGTQKGGLILKGDPGVGKTSFVKQLAQVMGVKLITVETPHLVEEHIVNIPFIVFNPATNSETKSEIKGGAQENGKFVVKIADSDLYNQIAHVQIIPEATALASIYRAGGLVKQLHEELGGTKDSFEQEVEELRGQFRCILFLDEYYRETSAAIRNMLRGILDNKIGLHEMPKTVYTIFASNMNGGSEEGIEQVAQNQAFRSIEFDAPGKDEWFNYLIKKYHEDNAKVSLKPVVIKAFYEVMHEDHISTHDYEADIRLSPRRWEQLITYINAALPCKDVNEARHLLKNVHVNFRHYQTGKHYGGGTTKKISVIKVVNGVASFSIKGHGKKVGDSIVIYGTGNEAIDKDQIVTSAKGASLSFVTTVDDTEFKNATLSAGSLSEEVYNVVAELIRRTSNIDLGQGVKGDAASDGDWRDTLKHQLDIKMRLGEDRHYIPVIAGLPGVGKTSHVFQVAYELGLVPVYINVANLSAEDVIGLPIANKGKGDEIAVEFSIPMLKQVIDKSIREGEADMQKVMKQGDLKVDMDAFNKKPHKYLIFFDELNRASTKVFNALRRVILEKKFTDDVGLPNGSVVIAAINPHDLGTTKLTSHMRDVLDIIPTGATWKQTEDYLKSNLAPELSKTMKNSETVQGVLGTLFAMYNAFSNPAYKHKMGTEEDGKSQFHLNIGHSDIYVSPRDWCDMFSGTCNYIDRHITRFKRFAHQENDGAAVSEAAQKVQNALYDGIKPSLDWIITHIHETPNPGWFQDFKTWIEQAPEANHLGLTNKKASILSAKEVYENSFNNPKVLLSDDPEFINYMTNVDATTFKKDLINFIIDTSKNDKSFMRDYIHNLPTLSVDKSGKSIVSSLHSAKEFHNIFAKSEGDPIIHRAVKVHHEGKEHTFILQKNPAEVKAKLAKEHKAIIEAGAHVKVSHYESFLHDIIVTIMHHHLSNEFLDMLTDVSNQVIQTLSAIYTKGEEGSIITEIISVPSRIKAAIRVYSDRMSKAT